MDAIVIPGWVMSNIGGFVGFGILSGVLFKLHMSRKGSRADKREQKRQDKEQQERDQRDLERRIAVKKERDKRDRELHLERLLPGPWRTFYEFLHGYPNATRQAVLLAAVTFERDVGDIPDICPGGFDLILEVSYYNLGGSGNCHEEFVGILGHHVKFPKVNGN